MKNIDCLLIGNNQIPFEEYEKSLARMGKNSGAYKDLNNNFLTYNKKVLSAADIFNVFCSNQKYELIKPIEAFNNGLAYLGTYLNRRNYSFAYINSFNDEKNKLMELLTTKNILSIAILTTFYVSTDPIIEILEFIKKHNRTAKIIIGGPFIATKFRTLNESEMNYLMQTLDADYYVNNSQGEQALINILYALKNNKDFYNIENICYKNNAEYFQTNFVAERNPLDENTVDWQLFANDINAYANVRTCISCPFNCTFCGFPEHAGKFETISIENVEKELNLLTSVSSLRCIFFTDDTLNIPVKRFKGMLRMMIKNKYPFKWISFFRCQFIDEEMVTLMKESGCAGVLLGLESGNDEILRNMNKKATVSDFIKGIDYLHQYEITSFGNLIFGFPGETQQTALETIDFIKNSKLDFYRTQLWYCEHITPIWRQRDKYGITGGSFEWAHNTMNSSEAIDLVKKSIIEIDTPVRYPQYYFDFDNISQLTEKGLSLHQTKDFLRAFNEGIKEKILNPNQNEISARVIEQIFKSCNNGIENFNHPVETINTNAAFNF